MTKRKLLQLLSTLVIAIASTAITTPARAIPPEPVCGSGGIGSTGCNIGAIGLECGVTCAANYYSCCNATSLDGGEAGCHCQPLYAQ